METLLDDIAFVINTTYSNVRMTVYNPGEASVALNNMENYIHVTINYFVDTDQYKNNFVLSDLVTHQMPEKIESNADLMEVVLSVLANDNHKPKVDGFKNINENDDSKIVFYYEDALMLLEITS